MSKSYNECLNIQWQEHFVLLDNDIKMAYSECGPASGSELLLIHGVTDGRVSWAQVAPILAGKGYHCYVVEYRGNGMTDNPDDNENGYTAELIAEDLIDYMRKKEIGPVHVIGHSYGSLICQILALKAPQKCKSYTLINTAVDCTNNPTILWVRDGDNHEYLGINGYSDGMPENFLKIWTANTNEDENFRMAIYEHTKKLSMASWRNLINGLLHFDNRQGISQITGNVMVLWGTEDDIFSQADQDQVKAGLVSCNARFITIEGASHNGFWDSLEMAEKYANIIDEFIKSI